MKMTEAEAFDKMLKFVQNVAEGRTAERGNYASTAQWLLKMMADSGVTEVVEHIVTGGQPS